MPRANPEENRAYHKAWYEANKERRRAQIAEWRKNNKDKISEYNKKYSTKIRKEVLEAYGSVCQCCGEDVYEFLAIDHINNDGAEQRKQEGFKNGQSFYYWLKNNGYPEGYQVLCHNCNLAKGFYGKCPHAREQWAKKEG